MNGERGFIVRVHGPMSDAVRARMTGTAPGGVLPEYGGAWESVDVDGKPLFRLGVAAESDEAARAKVKAWLAGLEVEVGAADPIVPAVYTGRHEEITHRAIGALRR